MTALTLTCVTRPQGNNADLLSGAVVPDGVRLDFIQVPVLVDGFRRMVRGLEFDVCEMAITTYLTAKAHGRRFTALPVFLVRGLHHRAIIRRAGHGPTDPKQLEGRPVGVNRGYTVTTGVWARGILSDECQVNLDRVQWVRSADEHVQEYVPPSNVSRSPPGDSLQDLLLRGELAAVVGMDSDHPGTAPLLPDADQRALELVRTQSVFPINHLIVVRDELLEAHPGLATALFDAFTTAKRHYLDQLRGDRIEQPTEADLTYRRVLDLTGEDPLPYGLAGNRATLDRLLSHAVAQHILPEPVELEQMFAAETATLTG